MSSGPKIREAFAVQPCGCRVEIRRGELHVYPCPNRQHEDALTTAAREIAEERGIDYEEVDDDRPQ